ncbi:MAG: peptidylprolyl isomerase [Candidatus Falkowbacteria bacterium]
MKSIKVFFILIVFTLLILTGCSLRQTGEQEQANMPNDLNSTFNEDELLQGVSATKNTLVGQVSSSGKTGEASDNNQVVLEDLAAVYNQAIIKTNFGNIKVVFYPEASPITVSNFMNLAKKGFYNGTKFHRVIKDFMIQGGDPNSKDDDWSNDGTGGPGYQFEDEINAHELARGSLAMANSGPNTNGSQFFIVTTEATPHLDGKHTNFGQIIEGMDVVDKIEAVEVNNNDHPLKDVIIENIELVNSEDTPSRQRDAGVVAEDVNNSEE